MGKLTNLDDYSEVKVITEFKLLQDEAFRNEINEALEELKNEYIVEQTLDLAR